MGLVSYDKHSFIIDGRRVIINSGEIHYFRVHPDLWEDRIKTAVDMGFNAIASYSPWNFHEPEKGKMSFTGDGDVRRFYELCAKHGLYVIGRPGPYICAEWEFGGLPAWLINEEDVQMRPSGGRFLAYALPWMRAYFDQIRDLQITRGGNVILMQLENEFKNISPYDPHMIALRDAAMESGINVPYIVCQGKLAGGIEGINAAEPYKKFESFRFRQPGAPLFATEFYPGWYRLWGDTEWHVEGRKGVSAEQIEHALWMSTALGSAGYNMFVLHGGTNFGYNSCFLMCTSYDLEAPISEDGSVKPDKFAAIKLHNLFCREYNGVLTESDVGDLSSPAEGVRVVRRASESGTAVFFINETEEPYEVVDYLVDGGVLPHLKLQSKSVSTVLLDVSVGNVRIELATCPVLQCPEALLCYGQAGEKHEIVINGQPFQLTVPDNSRAEKVSVTGATILVMNRETAANRIHVPLVDSVELRTQPIQLTSQPELPEITGWKRLPGAEESAAEYDDSGWIEIDGPERMEKLGAATGYGWYRTRFNIPDGRLGGATSVGIYFYGFADRLQVFLNGGYVGAVECPLVGPKEYDFFGRIDVPAVEGDNVLAVLCDNLGHVKLHGWARDYKIENDEKGIFGKVVLECHIQLRKTYPFGLHQSNTGEPWRFHAQLNGEVKGWTDGTGQWHELDGTEAGPIWLKCEAEFSKEELELPDSEAPIRIKPEGLGKGFIWANGFNLGRYWEIGPQESLYIPKPVLIAGKNTIVIFDEFGGRPNNVRFTRKEGAL